MRALRHVELGSSKFWAGLFTSLFLSSVLLDASRWVYKAFQREPRASEIFFPCSRAAFPLEGERSFWHTVKLLPPPADCRVQGFVIEALEPELNFRRPYSLGYARNLEDKTQVLPYMRAAQDLTLRMRERRVLLDLGAGKIEGSVQWFMTWYPLDFTEIHVFESDPEIFKKPVPGGPSVPDLYQQLQENENFTQWRQLSVPDWALRRITAHNDFMTAKNASVNPKAGPRSNITQFIEEGLMLREEDAVIVKMDIDGEEWDILMEWMERPKLAKIVDEIWVKMYYKDPTVSELGWDKYEQNREKAMWLLNRMRQNGFFIHFWP